MCRVGEGSEGKGRVKFPGDIRLEPPESLTDGLKGGGEMRRLCVTTEGFRPDESSFLKPNLTTICAFLFLENTIVKLIISLPS